MAVGKSARTKDNRELNDKTEKLPVDNDIEIDRTPRVRSVLDSSDDIIVPVMDVLEAVSGVRCRRVGET